MRYWESASSSCVEYGRLERAVTALAAFAAALAQSVLTRALFVAYMLSLIASFSSDSAPVNSPIALPP